MKDRLPPPLSAAADATPAESETAAAARLRALLGALREEKDLVAFVVRERSALLEGEAADRLLLRAPDAGRLWMHRYSDLMDAVIRRLWSLARERTGHEAAPISGGGGAAGSGPGIAVLAAGGYGMRWLAPHSDLDITIVAARDDDPPVLRELFRLIMGVLTSGARLSVGYGYRTLADVGGDVGDEDDADGGGGILTLDHQTQTALLEARLVAGDPALFARFDRHFHQHLQVADFLFRKEAERRRRRERYGSTPRVTEPNIKEGPGGLRDLQTAGWMARVRFGRRGGGDNALWHDLVRRRIITREEQDEMEAARDLLLTVRCLVHRVSGERRDLLSRGRQENIAALLETDDGDGGGGAPPPDALERFMRRWYVAADRIQQISDKVVARCLDAPLPLDAQGLSAVRRAVVLADPSRAVEDLFWPVRALAYCQTYGLSLAVATEEAMQRWAEETRRGADNSPSPLAETLRAALGPALLELLGRAGDVTGTVRRMERTGLLELALPELTACMGLIAYDPAHACTVGEHTLRVLENLTRLRPPESAAVGYPTAHSAEAEPDPEVAACREILAGLESPPTLFLAALLHDIGKQWPTLRDGATRAPHEETGAERTPGVCARLGCPPAMAERVTLLVRQHLLMAETSRLRDLNLTETIRDFAAALGNDRENLRMLYLLTRADTAAVGPGIWTPMKARQLAELYERAEAYLAAREDGGYGVVGAATAESAGAAAPAAAAAETAPHGSAARGEADPDRIKAARDRVRRQLAREAERAGTTEDAAEAVRAHIEAMPAAYLLNTPLPVQTRHLGMVARLLETGRPVVDIRTPAPDATYSELTVVAYDDPQPGLLSKIAGALLAFDANVHSVQAFTRPAAAAAAGHAAGPESGGGVIVVDTLTIDYRDRPLTPLKRADVEEALTSVLTGETALPELLRRRRRDPDDPRGPGASRHAPVRLLAVDDRVGGGDGDGSTLLDLEAPDEPGLVYRLAHLFSDLGWNIHAARLSAWAGMVRLAVYVTDRGGGPVPQGEAWDRLDAAFSPSAELPGGSDTAPPSDLQTGHKK